MKIAIIAAYAVIMLAIASGGSRRYLQKNKNADVFEVACAGLLIGTIWPIMVAIAIVATYAEKQSRENKA